MAIVARSSEQQTALKAAQIREGVFARLESPSGERI